MARVPLKGLNRARATLSDGRMVIYYYAWKGGPRVIGEYGSPEFFASYHAAHARRVGNPSIFHAIIAGYKANRAFTGLAQKTRKDYLKYISAIEQTFADMPMKALDDPRVTQDLLEWRDSFRTDRQRDYAWTVLMRVISWGRERGLTVYRPPARLKRLYRSDRADKIWLKEHIGAFRAVAPEPLWWALVLAHETGQRQGDLLGLPWSAWSDGWITLRQSKGGRRVAIPVSADLRTVLECIPRRSPVMLTNSRGLTWTSDGFRTSWGKAATKAGIVDLHFHDLRGTAVTRLAEAGCTTPEIAAITGHSLKAVEAILDRYLARTRGLALSAIAKLEKHRK
jgi:integrase